MIDRSEIESKSREFEIHPSNVERDYVFGWMLFGIFTVSSLKDSIFLKGGNALRKGYFENTRFSPDLDFGIPGNIAPDHLLNEINKVCDIVQEKAGIVFLKEDNRVEEKFTASEAPIPGLRVFETRIYFKDFYGNADHIRIKIVLDVTRFDRTMLPIQNLSLIHPYSDAAQLACQIRCMKLEEIIAVKLKCLLQRQHAPDLFDYAHSIRLMGGNLDKGEVARTLVQKTIFRRNPHVLKNILLETPFEYLKGTWTKALICAKEIFFEAEEAIKVFVSDLETLFSIFPDNGYRQFAYFGPELRIPIMEAGRNQTLLKIRYKGAERMVEPYSLKYLQRRDGAEREYLYVYNGSGGENEPGIRCFVAENVQHIENTNEKYEPRFVIELSKAGEKPENPYLFDPNRPTRAPRLERGARRASSGPKYIYQCGYCGRKFRKSTNNGSLGQHKDKNGYPCSGRFGYYVDSKY